MYATTTNLPKIAVAWNSAFSGLGSMGGPIVKRLLSAGYEITMSDVNPEAVEAAVSLGVIAAGSVKEASDANKIYKET